MSFITLCQKTDGWKHSGAKVCSRIYTHLAEPKKSSAAGRGLIANSARFARGYKCHREINALITVWFNVTLICPGAAMKLHLLALLFCFMARKTDYSSGYRVSILFLAEGTPGSLQVLCHWNYYSITVVPLGGAWCKFHTVRACQ